MNKFAKNIKLLRLEKNLTQKALGKELGVSSHTIYGWEKDNKEPNFDMLIKISQYFNISIDE